MANGLSIASPASFKVILGTYWLQHIQRHWGCWPLTKPGSDFGSDSLLNQISDRIGLCIGSDRIGSDWYLQNYYFWEKAVLTMTQVDRIFFFKAAYVSNKKNYF